MSNGSEPLARASITHCTSPMLPSGRDQRHRAPSHARLDSARKALTSHAASAPRHAEAHGPRAATFGASTAAP